MKTIQTYIDSKQNEFMSHPFFGVLENSIVWKKSVILFLN